MALHSRVDRHDGGERASIRASWAAIGSADNKSSCDGAAGTLNATVPAQVTDGVSVLSLRPRGTSAWECRPRPSVMELCDRWASCTRGYTGLVEPAYPRSALRTASWHADGLTGVLRSEDLGGGGEGCWR